MAVAEFLACLECRLPELVTAHVHYVEAGGAMLASTWMRRRRPDYPSYSGIPLMLSANGVVVYNTPRLGRLCCVDSFTGLVPSRNRS
ncbi:hypothetical protein MTO96_045207 [Rhipicephalus appendiculatus]